MTGWQRQYVVGGEWVQDLRQAAEWYGSGIERSPGALSDWDGLRLAQKSMKKWVPDELRPELLAMGFELPVACAQPAASQQVGL